MAKKQQEEAYEAFLSDVLATVPEDRRAAAEELLRHDKVREGVMGRAEISRQAQQLADARKQLDADLADARTKIKGWEDWYAAESAKVGAREAKLQRYQDTYGDLDGDGNGTKPTKFVSAEDFDKRLHETIGQRDAAAIEFADVLTDLKFEHRDRFKERLDTAALLKLAGEKNLPLRAAYREFVAEKVETLRKTEMDEAVKHAREEGAREALAKHNLPVIPASAPVLPIDFGSKDIPRTHKDRVAAAVEDWNKQEHRPEY